jgi:squalene-associated FAD-dependent desaturase
MPGTVHIVGAGLAGLAAAVRLAGRGVAVVIHEATDQAGGRCRSYNDVATAMRIDNGTHILLSGNHAALAFLAELGASAQMRGATSASFPFIDLATGERWSLDLGKSRLPLWMFDRRGRAPATRALDYMALARLMWPGPDTPLAKVVRTNGMAYERVLRPFLLAALNIEPEAASSALARAVLAESIAAGGQACRPYLAPHGLAAAFVEPALAFLDGRGAVVRFADQVHRFVFTNDAVTGLDFGDRVVDIGTDDRVVLAVPAYAAGALVPALTTPQEYRAIINAHFRMVPPHGLPTMTGVLNGVAEWIFGFDDRVCVTISGADRYLRHNRDEIAAMIWRDVERVAGVAGAMPPWQIVRERRATFAATPAQNTRRPGTVTRWRNLALAGDWTDTGLPATIESAVRSGNRAADIVMQT